MILILTRWRRASQTTLLASLLVVSACAAPGQPAPTGPRVIATTSILAAVAGSLDLEVASLIPDGVDPHDFEPAARDLASLRSADLVVAIGLGLEGSLGDALDLARADGIKVLDIGPLVDPLIAPGGSPDPHVWTDPSKMAIAVKAIGQKMAEIDDSRDWKTATAAAEAEMAATDDQVRAALDRVTNRRLVTDHLTLGYLAHRYGFEVVGSLIPSASTLGSPSSRDTAALLNAIRTDRIPAIFVQPGGPEAFAESIASQAGFPVKVVEIRVESMGPDNSGYREWMLQLAHTIAGGLG